MAKKKRSKTWKLALDAATLEKLAYKIMDDQMTNMISADHKFCKTSGVWRNANGKLTFRFAFRTSKGGSVVQTFRNVPDPRTFGLAADV